MRGVSSASGVVAAAALAAMVLASPAVASQLIDRNAIRVSLAINGKGDAIATYTAAGKVRHVLAWGAVDAIPPTRARKQVAFKLDYSGGYSKYRISNYWLRFGGVCLPYDGPALAWKVTACKAPDGSYWALQAWQRALPNYGVQPTPAQAAWELRLSHWRGALPLLQITPNWAYRRYDHIFGTYTYGGVPVYGFASTAAGVPLDTFGRNIYVDTYNSAYGPRWNRENSFLTHAPRGAFCYGFYPHGSHPSGNGTTYRATVQGPGVAPDVMWQADAPGPFDPVADARANVQLTRLGDRLCKPN
jgi:hypothetical protein